MRLIRARRIFGVRLLRCSAWHYWRHNVVESETSKDKLIVCKRSSSRRSSWRSCVRLQIILYIILILWAQTQGLDVSTFVVLAQHVNKYWLFLPRWTVVMNCFHGDKPRPLSGTSSTNEPHKMTWRASCLTPVSCTKENLFSFLLDRCLLCNSGGLVREELNKKKYFCSRVFCLLKPLCRAGVSPVGANSTWEVVFMFIYIYAHVNHEPILCRISFLDRPPPAK